MKKDLKSLTLEMDETIGTVNSLVESLNDLKAELNLLRQSMDIAVHRGEERLYYNEHHRTVRILDDLMYYLMNDLVPASEKARELHLSIFESVRGLAEHEHPRDRAQGGSTEGAA